MKKKLLSIMGIMVLTFAFGFACDSPQEEALEEQAEEQSDALEDQADQLEERADEIEDEEVPMTDTATTTIP